MERTPDYFIGVTLPEDLEYTIDSARRWMQRKWGNRSGMRTQCHITLVPPFSSDKPLSEMKEILSGITVPEVKVRVSGWGSFGERTIYARVEKDYNLELLKKEIEKKLREGSISFRSEKKFAPHITIANRDIKPYSFIPSMEYLNENKIDVTFAVNSIMIFSFVDRSWRSGEEGRVRFFS